MPHIVSPGVEMPRPYNATSELFQGGSRPPPEGPESTGVATMGHWGTCPLDFQLFNFSGNFRAAKTLTLESVWLPIQKEYTGL